MRDGRRAGLESLRAAFPDYSIRVADAIGQRDRVVVREVETGTHEGDPGSGLAAGLLEGVAPTGRRFQVGSIHVYRVTGGWIAEHWESRDDLGLLVQLGVIAPGG